MGVRSDAKRRKVGTTRRTVYWRGSVSEGEAVSDTERGRGVGGVEGVGKGCEYL